MARLTETTAASSPASGAVETFFPEGHSRYWLKTRPSRAELCLLEQSFDALSPDPAPGNRELACQRLLLSSSGEWGVADAGGCTEVLGLGLMQAVLELDMEVAWQLGFARHAWTEVFLQQIRHRAEGLNPSLATPPWLHRREEPLTFLHHVRRSENAIGGETLLSGDGRTVDRIFRMEDPLETLALDRSIFHMETPIGSRDGQPATRDLLVVTFSPARRRRLDS
jgi:hypothetical protein